VAELLFLQMLAEANVTRVPVAAVAGVRLTGARVTALDLEGGEGGGAVDHEVDLAAGAGAPVVQPLQPAAVGVVGKLARRGHIPLGYYNDPEKTAATFPTVNGERWSIPGDHARIERWRRAQALHRTLKYRPDLLEANGGLSETDRRLLEEFPSVTYP
jgi:acyl-CoA synthetase (AMP-forming)/AMP-acid ligase II